MDLEIITAVSSLGVGAVFGIVVFLVYRNHCATTEKRMSEMINADIKTREEHTKAITELTVWLKAKNGSH
jgi:hypothetical protein